MKGYETCGARNADKNFGSRAEKQPSIVSLTVLTPAVARNCGRLFTGPVSQWKAHVFNEVAHTGSSPVRFTTIPKQAGAWQQRRMSAMDKRVICTRAFSLPEPRERLAVRGRTSIRKTACSAAEANRQVPSPTISVFHAEPPEVVIRAQPYTAASPLDDHRIAVSGQPDARPSAGADKRGMGIFLENSDTAERPSGIPLSESETDGCIASIIRRVLQFFSPCTRSLHLGSVTSPEPYGAGGLL